jgi:hypothetical protein
VDVEDEVPLLGREEKVLAAPAGPGEPATFECRQRRIERLQRGDVRRPGPLDRCDANGIVEGQPGRLDLGKLGNSSSSWTRSA